MSKRRSSALSLEQSFKRISIRDPVLRILSYHVITKTWLVKLESGKEEYRAYKDVAYEPVFEQYLHSYFKQIPHKPTAPSYIT
jgi:hypothetical protein